MPAKPKKNVKKKTTDKNKQPTKQKSKQIEITLPVPATEMTLENSQHKIRSLKKRIREIESLEELSKKGTRLHEAQIDKVQRKQLIEDEIERLSNWAEEKLEITRIHKKLNQITKLTKAQEEGALLSDKELQKLSLKSIYLEQLSHY